MNKKIKLTMYVESYNLHSKNAKVNMKCYNYTKEYSGNLKLRDVMALVSKKFSFGISNRFKTEKSYFIRNLYDITWGKYFPISSNLGLIDNLLKIYDYTLFEIENSFNISDDILVIVLNGPGVGGCYDIKEGIRFYFHSNEADIHHIPYVHCSYSGEEFRVNLCSLQIMDESFKSKTKTKNALKYIKENQEGLINYWNTYVSVDKKVDFDILI